MKHQLEKLIAQYELSLRSAKVHTVENHRYEWIKTLSEIVDDLKALHEIGKSKSQFKPEAIPRRS